MNSRGLIGWSTTTLLLDEGSLATLVMSLRVWLPIFMTSSDSAILTLHPSEFNIGAGLASRLNWLRAGVLGANDGIVSVAAVVVGVAGASHSTTAVIAAGSAALVGGAIAMALGEYVSVSSQRDSQNALIAKTKRKLAENPERELAALAGLYLRKGLSKETAHRIAVELSAIDPVKAHLSAELNLDEDDVVSATHAAWVSALAFTSGGLLPLLAITLASASVAIPMTFAVVVLALIMTGVGGAKLGGSSSLRATVRILIGGIAALAATFVIGSMLGTSVIS